MKKLVLAFVAVAAISFASCGNTQKPVQNAGDTITKDTIDTPQVEKIDSPVVEKVDSPAVK